MAKFLEQKRALELRTAGRSYSQIKSELGVSKSTLSNWLRDYPLSQKRIRELRDWNEQRIERYRETRRKKREEILNAIYKRQKSRLLPLSKRELFIGGLFLYWGEGGKTKLGELTISNTDPAVIITFIHWLKKCFGVKLTVLRVRLHLYKDMNVRKETKFWSSTLKIPISQFRSPYVKNSNRASLTYKNGFGHGTCNVMLSGAKLAKEVLMGLRAMNDYFMKMRL